MRRMLPAWCAALVAVVAGCGGSDQLDKGDANSLEADRATLSDDVRAIAAIDGEQEEAKRLVTSESAYAVSDPPRALRGPLTDHVRSMLIDVEDASPSTKVPTLHDQSVKQVLGSTAAALRPFYPDQAARLRAKANG